MANDLGKAKPYSLAQVGRDCERKKWKELFGDLPVKRMRERERQQMFERIWRTLLLVQRERNIRLIQRLRALRRHERQGSEMEDLAM